MPIAALLLMLSAPAPTAADTENNNSFSFIVWGHPRGDSAGELSMYYDEVLGRITELDADLLILTGDMIYGYTGKTTDPDVVRSEWERFDSGLKQLEIPVYRLPGNHDIHNNITRDIFIERYPSVPFAFTFRNNRFIMLDTIGIHQQGVNDHALWKGGISPFDSSQLQFIQNEIRQQAKYDHVFIFMHHPQPWATSSGFWWESIHPIIADGNTRAVFAGSPWYFKYAHMEKDNIHYFLSSVTNDPDPADLRKIPNPDELALQKQLNNILSVRVEKDILNIEPVIIGALSSKVINWSFWDKVESMPAPWARSLAFRFHKRFFRFRDLVIAEAAWGGLCILIGAFFAAFWCRIRSRKGK